ncbi:HGGxSTG domain-containing protein [Pseudarthrobacter albicanus]|uniref:HGGxSTG domain-containing protein n=1 Tax=Pseudarthrobacter albicanus TaxID=2823873 RepID=UPI001BAB5479|nr:HGGxSTG domain-containing protein [Pseudarthrobacter albicanus]
MQAQCKATARSGEQCSNPPISGGSVCRMHGGSAPAVKAAAARRLEVAAVEADVRAVIASEGLEGVTDPLEALARLATETLAMKSALAARVNALSDITTTSKLGVEALKVEVALYERAIDRSGKFLDLLAKSNFEERRLQIDEQTAGMFVTVMKNVLARLDLSPAQQALVGTVVPEALRALNV